MSMESKQGGEFGLYQRKMAVSALDRDADMRMFDNREGKFLKAAAFWMVEWFSFQQKSARTAISGESNAKLHPTGKQE